MTTDSPQENVPCRSTAREIVSRRIVQPLVELLRVGTTPRQLAWSLAVGVAIGINPILGSTTIFCLIAAFLLRLNLVASQISNHLMYPLQLVLFFFFIRVGDHLFHTPHMPIHGRAIVRSAAHHPWDTTRLLWTWEWHALIVWLVLIVFLVPLVAAILTPLLEQLHKKIHGATAETI